MFLVFLSYFYVGQAHDQIEKYPNVGFAKIVNENRFVKMIKYDIKDSDTIRREDIYFDKEGRKIKVLHYELENIGRQLFYEWDKELLMSIVQISATKDTSRFYFSYTFPIISIFEKSKNRRVLSKAIYYNNDSTKTKVINYGAEEKILTVDSIFYTKSSIINKFYEKGKILLEDITHIVDLHNEIGYSLDANKNMTEFTKRVYNDSKQVIQEIRGADSNVIITNYIYEYGKLMAEEEIYNGCTKYLSIYKYE